MVNENSLLYGFLKNNLFIEPKAQPKPEISMPKSQTVSICYFGKSNRGKKVHIINRFSHISLCADTLKDITEINDYFTNEKLIGCKKCIQIYNTLYNKERGITNVST